MIWMFLGGLLGCTPSEGSGGSDDSGGQKTESDEFDFGFDRPEPEPQWTAEETADHVETWGRELGFPLPHRIFERLDSVLGEGDDTCPGKGPGLDQLDGCTSESGYIYRGLVITYDDDKIKDGVGTLSYGYLLADFVIAYPDGATFTGGGHVDLEMSFGDRDEASARITGAWEDQGATDSWLHEPSSFEFFVTKLGDQYSVHGTVGMGPYALHFDNVYLSSPGCENTLQRGTISVRQDDGSWMAVEFQEDCSGCGTVVWNEELELGSACVDLTEPIAEVDETLSSVPK